ncbi:MAG: DegT/DnrJ/EryC1/StrS family aminotransferase [Acidobacteriota bacterium]
MIPLIKADLPTLDEIAAPLREALASGRVTNFGPHVQQFEKEIGAYVGAGAVCVSSATAGLIMTLQGLSIPRGSRIVIPSFSFVATAQAVLYAGCVPVFVDVGRDGNADLEDLARVLGHHTDVRGVLLVHMYGLPCDTDAVASIVGEAAQKRGETISVIYDGAHAFGSSRNGVPVGQAGDAEVFSTSVTKVLTSIEGGIVTSRNEELLDRLRRMRNYGIHASYDAHWPGLNGKMSELHAMVGRYNLARLDELLGERQRRAAYYADRIRRRTSFRVMAPPSDVISTYKDFTIELPEMMKAERDALSAGLLEKGIETRAYFFPPIHEQRYFRRYVDRHLPVTEDLSRRVLTLPFSSSIADAQMDRVADALAEEQTRLGGLVAESEVHR